MKTINENITNLITSNQLADLLHVSRTTAWRIRKSGVLAPATYIIGVKSVRYDPIEVLHILRETNNMPWAKR